MRLWHENLINKLPRQQLLGQHRECSALRGNGWGKKHSTVDYVFEHDWIFLSAYHMKIIGEMEKRGYTVDPLWKNCCYRGKNVEPHDIDEWGIQLYNNIQHKNHPIYKEHNEEYMKECIDNLKNKNIYI